MPVNIIDDDQFEVWLDTDIEVRDGVCLSTHEYRVDAIDAAIKVLEGALVDLKEKRKE